MNYLKCSLVTGALIALMMGVSGAAMANSDDEQLKRMADPDQWPAPGRDFALTRHSALADINPWFGTCERIVTVCAGPKNAETQLSDAMTA